MKRGLIFVLILAVIVLGIFVLISCTEKSKQSNLLLGTWEWEFSGGEMGVDILVFKDKKNGEGIVASSYEQISNSEEERWPFTYVDKGETIEITYDYEGETYIKECSYRIEDAKLIIKDWYVTEDETIYCKK